MVLTPDLIVVFGAAGGMGRAVTDLARNQGFLVVGYDKAPRADGEFEVLELDACDPVEVERGLSDAVRSVDGGTVAVVNAVGVPSRGTVADVTPEEFDRVININLRSRLPHHPGTGLPAPVRSVFMGRDHPHCLWSRRPRRHGPVRLQCREGRFVGTVQTGGQGLRTRLLQDRCDKPRSRRHRFRHSDVDRRGAGGVPASSGSFHISRRDRRTGPVDHPAWNDRHAWRLS